MLIKAPLSQFQFTRANKADIFKLVRTLNGALGESKLHESLVEEALAKWWPDLEQKLEELPKEDERQQREQTRRDQRDLLEEILALVRNLNRVSKMPPAIPSSRLTDAKERQAQLDRVVRRLGSRADSIWSKPMPTGWDPGAGWAGYTTGASLITVLQDNGHKYEFLVADELLEPDLSDYIQDGGGQTYQSPPFSETVTKLLSPLRGAG